MTHSAAQQIISIMALWVLFLFSIRFTIITTSALSPLFVAGVRSLRWGFSRRDWARELDTGLDAIFMRLNIALATPWSVTLLFIGMGLTGCAFYLNPGGDVMTLVAVHPERWENINRYMDWFGSLCACFGMSLVLAAISKRRLASLVISCGFACTGYGIAIVAVLYL